MAKRVVRNRKHTPAMLAQSPKLNKTILFAVTIDYQLQYHQGLFHALKKDGWDVHVVSGPGERLSDLDQSGDATVHPIRMSRAPNPIKDIVGLIKLLTLMLRLRPDVLFVGTPKASLLGLAAGLTARIKKRVYMVHGLRLEGARGWRRSLLTALERTICALATDVLPVSKSLSAKLSAELKLNPKKVTVLGGGSCNGVEISLFRPRRKPEVPIELQDIERPIIGFVGRLTRDKGLPELAAAMRELYREGFNITLLIVGPVDDDSGADGLRLLSDTGQKIIATGYVNDLENYYPHMDALVLPSLREGLPNVVLEAFASGTVVIGTSVTGIVDLITNDKTGLLVASECPASLSRAIRRAIEDRGGTHRMTVNAFSLVESQYNREHVLNLQAQYLNGML